MPLDAKLEYDKPELKRAGAALAGPIHWTTETEAEAFRIFAVANHWRESHAKPMSIIRAGIDGRRRALNLEGITVSRLKRMRSIRKKLSRSNLRLNQIQDLGGCRCVLLSMDDVDQLAESFSGHTPHTFLSESNYTEKPKMSGYRCRHLVFKFRSDDPAHDDRRIEVQIRTRLQHSWATAVEVVGTFRREDMKAGDGDSDWLRLFQLMSGEIARAEGCNVPEACPDKFETVSELRDLNEKLDAVTTLDSIRFAFSGTSRVHVSPNAKPEFYLIQYDTEQKTVSVHAYDKSSDGARQYDKAEEQDLRFNTYKYNTVLVEADKIEAIKLAFPNYFGDVQVFSEMLKRIVRGEDVIEYHLPPRQLAPRVPEEAPDLSWFRQHKHRKWF